MQGVRRWLLRNTLAYGGLGAKPIQHRAEHFVIIETITQGLVERYLIGDRAGYDALFEIRRAKSPDLAGEHYVVAGMDF